MLQFNNCSIKIKNRELITPFNLSLKPNETIYIIGENGTGKSTLLKEIVSTSKPNTIFYNNMDLYNLDIKSKANIFSLFLQNYTIQTDILVDEVLEFCNIYIEKLYNFFNIDKLKHRVVTTLSGGEKQKLFLYTFFAKEAQYYILDEPFNNLDIQSYIFLNNFFKTFSKSLIITIHDLNQIKIENAKIGLIFNKQLHFFNNKIEFINSSIFGNIYTGVKIEKKDNNHYFIY